MIDYKHNFLRPLYLLYKKAVSNRYTIGFIEFEQRIVTPNCDNSTLKYHWIKDNYDKGWFADPFILRIDQDVIVLLVEEFVYRLNRGVISLVKIDKNDYTLKSVKTIIDTGSHLSFPAYYRKAGKVYIYPESGQRGGTYLYELDEKKETVKELSLINPNVVADTILFEIPQKGVFQLCTTEPNFNKNILDIYPFSEKICSKKLSPVMRIQFENMTARNAGLVFENNGKLYRPAQDCTKRYGECVEIQEIVIDENNITFLPVNRLYSTNKNYPNAFHTFNVYENKIVVVDARGKRFPLLAKLLGK